MRDIVVAGLLGGAIVLVVLSWQLVVQYERGMMTRSIREITAVATRHAPQGGRTVTATVTLKASDPAMVRVYAWPAEQADKVEAYLAAHDQALGPWALGPVASSVITPDSVRRIEMTQAVRGGWLYAIAIEPLSLQHGGQFFITRADIDFGS